MESSWRGGGTPRQIFTHKPGHTLYMVYVHVRTRNIMISADSLQKECPTIIIVIPYGHNFHLGTTHFLCSTLFKKFGSCMRTLGDFQIKKQQTYPYARWWKYTNVNKMYPFLLCTALCVAPVTWNPFSSMYAYSMESVTVAAVSTRCNKNISYSYTGNHKNRLKWCEAHARAHVYSFVIVYLQLIHSKRVAQLQKAKRYFYNLL